MAGLYNLESEPLSKLHSAQVQLERLMASSVQGDCGPSLEARGAPKMRHRTLGHTGLIVSEVALGSMQFGGKMNMGNLGQEDTTRMVKLALDRGINFIDTADVYSLGESEILVGNALKGVRDE